MNALRGKNVLVAGGNGLIGSRLTNFLSHHGYTVKSLSRQKYPDMFVWNPSDGQIDATAVQWADYIVNLAGHPVADHRWSAGTKRKIRSSRLDAVELLSRAITSSPNHVKL